MIFMINEIRMHKAIAKRISGLGTEPQLFGGYRDTEGPDYHVLHITDAVPIVPSRNIGELEKEFKARRLFPIENRFSGLEKEVFGTSPVCNVTGSLSFEPPLVLLRENGNLKFYEYLAKPNTYSRELKPVEAKVTLL